MAPWIAMLAPALIEAVPKLAGIFSSGSKSSERNVRAIEMVADVAKQAVGARNEQDLLEILERDPAAVPAVRQAIEANWFKIEEVFEKSTAAARAFNTERERIQEVRFVVGRFTFIEFLTLVMVAVSLLGLAILKDKLNEQLLGAVCMLVLIGGYTGIHNYWFGSSRGSQLKTDLMAGQAGGTGTKQ